MYQQTLISGLGLHLPTATLHLRNENVFENWQRGEAPSSWEGNIMWHFLPSAPIPFIRP